MYFLPPEVESQKHFQDSDLRVNRVAHGQGERPLVLGDSLERERRDQVEVVVAVLGSEQDGRVRQETADLQVVI